MFIFFFGSRGFSFSLPYIFRAFRGKMRPVSRWFTCVSPESWRRLRRIPCLGWEKEHPCWRKVCLTSKLMGSRSGAWGCMKPRKGDASDARKTEQERSLLYLEIEYLESNRAQLDQWHLRLKGRISLGYIFYLLFNVVQQDGRSSWCWVWGSTASNPSPLWVACSLVSLPLLLRQRVRW